MDVPSPTPPSPTSLPPATRSDLHAELAALRRRAYGADADIHDDAVAQARLRELESVTRRPSARAGGPDGEPASDSAVVSLEALWADHRTTSPRSTASAVSSVRDAGTSASSASSAPSAGPASVTAVPAAPSTGEHLPARNDATPGSTVRALLARRGFWWTLGALALVIAVAIGTLTALAPRPYAVLRESQDESETSQGLEDAGFRDYLGMADGGEFQRYESFAGMPVWIVPSATGGRCIVLGDIDSGVDFGCGLGDLEATVDTIVDRGFLTSIDAEMPPGTIVRFILRGDAVEVWVAEAAEPEALG